MSDVVVAWKKGVWGKNRIYPEIDSKVFLGLIRLFDADKNEQIFVHREGEKVYYVYLWKLSKFDYISLGLLTNKLCLDYYDLLRTFRAFVKDMAVNELCVYNTKRGKVKLSSHNIQKQQRQRTLLDINIKNLKVQFDEKQKKWSNLPSQKLGILKSDIVPCTLEIQGSSWIVTQVTSGYRNVCISIRDENKPQNKDRRSKESDIFSIVKSLQFLPKFSNPGKTAKTLRLLKTTNGNKEKKDEKKHIDWSEIFAVCVIGAGIISVLLSCIAPWFISTMQMWLKITLFVASCLGVYLVIYTTDDNHKGKYVSFAGWSGVVTIFISTVFTIYGLCGGFSPDTVGEGGNIQTVKDSKYEYEIRSEGLNPSKSDRDNDWSDEEISIIRNWNEASENDTLRDSLDIVVEVNSQTNKKEQEYPSIEEHSYVDLGLSVLWASCNVGASTPKEFGDYYAWGEIETKKEYTAANYRWYGNKKRTERGYEYQLTKYNSDSYKGRVDNKNKLDDGDDVATVKWGNGWRIPTYKEWNELRKKCSWEWICIDDIYGYRVTSPVNNNSIFLPAAGKGGYQSQVGHYWASTLEYAVIANSVDFNKSGKKLDFHLGVRENGYSVRPVKTKESTEGKFKKGNQ